MAEKSVVQQHLLKKTDSGNRKKTTQAEDSNQSSSQRSMAKGSSVSRSDVDAAIAENNSQQAIEDRRNQNADQSVLGAIGSGLRALNDGYHSVLNTVGTGIDDLYDASLGQGIKDLTGIDTTNLIDGDDVGNGIDAAIQLGTMFLPGGVPAKLAAAGVSGLLSNSGQFANALQGVNEYGDRLYDGERLAALGSGALGTALAATGAGNLAKSAAAAEALGAGTDKILANTLKGGVKDAAKKAAKEGEEATVQKTLSNITKEAAKETTEEGAETAAKAAAKEAVKEGEEAVAKKAVKEGEEAAAKEATKEAAEEATEEAAEEVIEEAAKKGELSPETLEALEKGEANRAQLAKMYGSNKNHIKNEIFPNARKAVRKINGNPTNKDLLTTLAKDENIDLETLVQAQERGILDLSKVNEAAEAAVKAGNDEALSTAELIKSGLTDKFEDAYKVVADGEEASKDVAKLLAQKDGSLLGNAVKEAGMGFLGDFGGAVNGVLAYAGNGGDFNDIDLTKLGLEGLGMAAANRLGAGAGTRLASKGLGKINTKVANPYQAANNTGLNNAYARKLAALKTAQLGSELTKDEYGKNVLWAADLNEDEDEQ